VKIHMRFSVLETDRVENPHTILLTVVTWGFPSHPDNSDNNASIGKGQRSNSGKRSITRRVYF
jgi:hypothetical protein